MTVPSAQTRQCAPSRTWNGRCRRLAADEHCGVGAKVSCPFTGRGAGLCSWYAVEVNPDAETKMPMSTGGNARGSRRCPCGAPLVLHRKLCDQCRAEARRTTMRESQARWRLRVAERVTDEGSTGARRHTVAPGAPSRVGLVEGSSLSPT